MRAERRQELRTNELAQLIDDSREFFRTWGSYVLGGAVIVALIVAFAVYRAKAAGEQLSESWKSLQAVSFFDAKGEKKSEAEIRQGFARLDELAAENHGPDFLLEVLSAKSQSAMRLATGGKEGFDAQWLSEAEEGFETMRSRLPENPLAVATALNGLASIEADRFVIDGDPNRKQKARALLEKLRDDPRFNGTPFQRAALERINKLDDVFTRVEFAAAPPPPTQPNIELLPFNPAQAPEGVPESTPELPVPEPTPAPESESESAPQPEPETPPAAQPDDAAPEPAEPSEGDAPQETAPPDENQPETP